jgi:hypothetical protein
MGEYDHWPATTQLVVELSAVHSQAPTRARDWTLIGGRHRDGILAIHGDSIQWAVTDPAVNKPWRNGRSFNNRVADLAAPTNGIVSLLGTTFSGHALPYYSDSFNADNISQANSWLERIYGVAPSSRVFYPAERLVDTAALTKITTAKPSGLGFDYTFVDQMQHVRSWFNRTAALTESAHRVQQINGAKAFVINDGLSEYRFLNTDNGLGMALRDTLARKARSGIQDQSVILISDLNDFATATSANAYDRNIRWLASRPSAGGRPGP